MKIVLAGSSHWHAEMHLDAAHSCDAEIAGIWDEGTEHARRFATRHHLPFIADFAKILSSPPDVILLMGHPSTVPARARAVIEAGIPLILEKPAASSTGALAALRDLARQHRAFVSVPLPNRFGPAVTAFERLRQQGRAGAVAHCQFRLVNGPPQRYAAEGVAWVVDPAIGGGGALRNLGIHGVDAALSLATGRLGLKAVSIENRIHRAPVEDHALLVLEDSAGALFVVEAGYTFASMRPGGDFEWRIVSENATLIDYGDRAICATLDDGAIVDLPIELPATRYRLCMSDTLSRLTRKAPPAISIDDYVAAMSLIDAAYEKTGR
ncbi:MAG: Gfo/Idh/MocA family oxidoreductase [Mesorhizobium sp.]|uniref:Gfo/Idh/MocA family protein n=1 Tax=unclassified Mesorhizobium TaxID=325217 RepID=UPI000FD2AA47|nr:MULTISPECIES: Gfo/Idh/MocA family oxidoreductase [unclassified Mesorhizobium]RUV27534.1 Gfo/Idh/MocA family oxidoreductase [Mesorhizobium sp. M5C.F.Ca.IN.020.32.2.1]RWC46210.1 MAG: Gfo/Idh/MocA family oxidoreductase [Mesorhizobium sp.]RWD53189.1 MAG: Gfo/Idh/MocA family oxidoreductase [Mesorhizobium sp.]RWE12087.1 MAG: Gfo/Idh/MocA family oxidoreductase [Mesorhizobium sp.]RWE63243.1 MAG: Gfo/Idh/MocA family oxidoreductase [Mesorhizobium sp.]